MLAMLQDPDPVAMAMTMAISNRINRGVIPFPTADMRCSYCFTFHLEDDRPLKCSRCKKVLYCDRECQRYVLLALLDSRSVTCL